MSSPALAFLLSTVDLVQLREKTHGAGTALAFCVMAKPLNHKDAHGGDTVVRQRESNGAFASQKDGVDLGVDPGFPG